MLNAIIQITPAYLYWTCDLVGLDQQTPVNLRTTDGVATSKNYPQPTLRARGSKQGVKGELHARIRK